MKYIKLLYLKTKTYIKYYFYINEIEIYETRKFLRVLIYQVLKMNCGINWNGMLFS